jgi:uncharacterized protein
VKRLAGAVQRGLVLAVLAPLRVYARVISPALPARCKYYPTCSAYAEQAVRELGVVRGTILAAWRLARCNPWSHGGVDELSDRRLFRAAPAPSTRGDKHSHGAAT